jgi:hypothetical protein
MMASQEHPHGHRVAGRDQAVIRGPHRHYCSICGNDWSHESHCLEGRTAACPWCAPSAGAEAQGARTGPHFHDCPSCRRTWRHSTTCAEPFRMALPDCPGCVDSHDLEPDSRTREPRAQRGRRAGDFRALVKACALSFLLTAGAILAFQHALKAWPPLWTTPPSSSVQLPERPSQPRGPAPSVAIAKRHEPAWTTPPSSGVQLPEQPRAESPPTSIRPSQPRGPEPSVAVSPRREPATIAPPATTSRTSPSASAPASSPPAPPLPSPPLPVTPPSARRDVAPQPSAPPSALPASPPEPERVVTSAAETPPPPSTVQASVAEPSVPGGPPAGVLGGGSSWETLPDHHPRSTERRTRLGNASR